MISLDGTVFSFDANIAFLGVNVSELHSVAEFAWYRFSATQYRRSLEPGPEMAAQFINIYVPTLIR